MKDLALPRCSSGAKGENFSFRFFKITKATMPSIRIYTVIVILLKFSTAITQVKFYDLSETCF